MHRRSSPFVSSAINQDLWTIPAVRIATPKGCSGDQWARNLSNGDIAVLTLNRADNKTTQTRLDFAALLPGDTSTVAQYAVRDVQANADLGVACGHIDFTLAPHQTAFVRLTRMPGSCTPSPPAQCTPPSTSASSTPPCPSPPIVRTRGTR